MHQADTEALSRCRAHVLFCIVPSHTGLARLARGVVNTEHRSHSWVLLGSHESNTGLDMWQPYMQRVCKQILPLGRRSLCLSWKKFDVKACASTPIDYQLSPTAGVHLYSLGMHQAGTAAW